MGTDLGRAIPEVYGQIINSLTSGVIAVDKDGVVVCANTAAGNHLNISPQVLRPGTRLEDLPHIGPFVGALHEVMETRKPLSRRLVTLSMSDGHIKEVGVSASLLRGPDPFNGVIFLFIDMTEMRNLERTAELNRQLAAIGELTAGVVHEIRNPLTVISGMAELLMRKLDSGDANYGSVEMILKEVQQLSKTISEFLSFARPFELQRRECRPETIIERAVKLCCPSAEKKEVLLQWSCEPGLPRIEADPDKAASALANVVTNAIEAVSKAGKVALRAYHQSGYIVFETTDNGPGVNVAPGEDLFKPFFSKRKEGGTGLGLAIVHRIVTAHKGTVNYSNLAHGGARFEIRLPISVSEP